MNYSTKSLIEGERKAHQIIENAKERKNDMSKNAKFDAQQELGEIKQRLDKQYQDVKEKTDVKIQELDKYELEAKDDLKEIHEAYEENKDAVTAMLLDQIMNIKLDLPRVVIGNFEENE